MAYAEDTKIPFERSIADVMGVIAKVVYERIGEGIALEYKSGRPNMGMLGYNGGKD